LCQAANCADGVRNGNETAVDCGGGTCPGCNTGQGCVVDRDCASTVCGSGVCRVPTCGDGRRNGAETDIDCGGDTCNDCGNGGVCSVDNDCLSSLCTAGSCVACANDAECGAGRSCRNGGCVTLLRCPGAASMDVGNTFTCDLGAARDVPYAMISVGCNDGESGGYTLTSSRIL
jgi:hypothetical protein